jgi:hypothetical protein
MGCEMERFRVKGTRYKEEKKAKRLEPETLDLFVSHFTS